MPKNELYTLIAHSSDKISNGCITFTDRLGPPRSLKCGREGQGNISV